MSEFGIIISILHDQSNLVYGDAYGVSFLLDPQYGGEVMDEEVRESVVDFVYNWNGPDHENAATVELMRIRCFSRRHSRAQIAKTGTCMLQTQLLYTMFNILEGILSTVNAVKRKVEKLRIPNTTPLAPTDETTTIIVIGATIVHGRNAVGDRGTVIVEDLYVAEEHCAEEDVYVVEDQYMAVELYVAEELCVVEQMYMAVELVCARRDGVVPDNSGSQDELLQHEWFTRPQSPTECRYADLLKFVIGDENFNAFEYVGDNGANAETMDIQFMDTV
ncbi:hypothetical protein L914_01290 [Phytophthora nicotianae]|uniref:Uncharacterized protein n=1 Tax=Phytophthora nicotianae TaxID=4792 RepID=W2P3V6_PHYNI|nr:hypothetical protein L914_01290 [Phytophthora nicotianae]